MIPTDFVDYVGDIRVISAEVTALTAGIDGDFEPGTTALRTGFTTPEAIANAAALWPMRPQRQLLAYVKTLSTNPWSVAEVEAHRMFRELGIRGWVGNPRLMIRGKAAYPDIALPAPKVAFEVNSYAHHSSKQDMERDSARLNLLVSAGWRVYSLTPNQIRNHPEETGAFVTSVVPRRWQHPLRTTMG